MQVEVFNLILVHLVCTSYYQRYSTRPISDNYAVIREHDRSITLAT